MDDLHDLPAPVVKVLREMGSRPLVQSMGHAGVVVYLDKRSGHPIYEGESDKPEDSIRLMVRTGKVPDQITSYKTNAKFIGLMEGYSRYAAINGSLSRFGLVVFESCDKRTIYAEQRNGTDDGVGYYTGFMHIADGLFAEYTYFSDSLDQHQKVNDEVCHWLRSN